MHPKKIRLALLIFAVLALVFLGLNTLLETVTDGYLQNKLKLQQQDAPYQVQYADLNLNIYTQELQLAGLSILPGRGAPGGRDTLPEKGLQGLHVGTARVRGINLSNFLWNKTLDIHSIDLDTLELILIRKDPDEENTGDAPRGLLLDSLELPGIREILLGDFHLGYFSSHLLEPETGDTLSVFESADLRITGMGMEEQNRGRTHTFIPHLDEMELHMGRQQYEFGEGLYALQYDGLSYRHGEEVLRIEGLAVRPELEADAFAARHPYSYARYKANIREIRLKGVGLSRILGTGTLSVGRMEIDQLEAEIFRDKTKPDEPGKNTPLPSRSLEAMGFRMSLDTLQLKNSTLSYYERLPDTDKHVEVSFSGLNGEIRNIRSSQWALDAEESLELELQTDLLGAIAVSLDLEMPYGRDALYFRGHTSGSSRLSELNPTVYPAMGMRFGGGRLDGITFNARGSSRSMRGELTMLYSDLEVELFKRDQSENKTLSWIANAVVQHSNPNRRGRVLVAEIDAERDPSKGVMNYVWKSIQSGVVNTFNPLGKRERKR